MTQGESGNVQESTQRKKTIWIARDALTIIKHGDMILAVDITLVGGLSD